MTASAPDELVAGFPHSSLPKVTGEPTLEDPKVIRRLLNTNAYVAVRTSVNNPSGKKGTPNAREALTLVMDQVKILLQNLQMVDPSFIFLPRKAKDRVGVESDLIATSEHVHDNYDFMRKYFPQFYVHKHNTYMYSNMIMDFNTPKEELLGEVSNILYGEHQAMYPR
jgi:hypothetical protein